MEIESAWLGAEQQVVTGGCLATVGEVSRRPLSLACAAEDRALAVGEYRKRAWVEQQNRDLKTGFLWCQARLATAARIERLWVVMELAVSISSCTESVHDPACVQRLSRRYQDGRRDLSWLSAAKWAALTGKCDVLLRPLSAQ